jgi:hypothetical protein
MCFVDGWPAVKPKRQGTQARAQRLVRLLVKASAVTTLNTAIDKDK